jgi:hypothetical protein
VTVMETLPLRVDGVIDICACHAWSMHAIHAKS